VKVDIPVRYNKHAILLRYRDQFMTKETEEMIQEEGVLSCPALRINGNLI